MLMATNGTPTLFERWKPRTTRRGLLIAAGFVWGGAGLLLLVRGYLFLPEAAGARVLPGILALIAGTLFFWFVFRTLTARNIARIRGLTIARPCLFSFQTWRSYIIMAIMITTGITVRSAGLIAPAGIGAAYVAMSVPLIVSSARLLLAGIRYQ
jgi:hypothetical protein